MSGGAAGNETRGGPVSRPSRSLPLYGIADPHALGGDDPAAVARVMVAMVRGGASWVQLRAKRVDDGALLRLARACRGALAGTGARLWIDDRADVAALVGADGVHVGQDDLPPAAVRRVVGRDCWIGRSTHDREQILEAARDPDVDVIAVGPVFPTTGKERPDPVVGLELLRWARARTSKPLVAIGGIDAARLPSVLAAGADTAAVLGALCRAAGDRAADHEAIERAARRLTAAADPAASGEERTA